MKNKTDLSQTSTKDLQDKVKEEKAGVEKMRFTHAISPIENPARIKHGRKTVARMMTELRKRELAEKKK